MNNVNNIKNFLRNLTNDQIIKFNDFENSINDYDTIASTIIINTVILVKNQEKNILNAIDSIYSISDKIWIYDTGSTDQTIPLIKNKYNNDKTIITEVEWIEDYSFMRNLAIEQIPNNEWTFFIDSDEILETKINKNELKSLLYCFEKAYPDKDLVLTVLQRAEGNDTLGAPQRIFKKSKTLKFYGFVHEELRSDIIEELSSQLIIFNSGTTQSEIEKFNKSERYNTLLLKNIKLEPSNFKWLVLLDPVFGIKNFPQYKYKYNNLFNKITKEFEKKQQLSNDIFLIKLFLNKILIEIINCDLKEAQNVAKLGVNYFLENSQFVYLNRYIEFLLIQNQFTQLLSDIKSDTQTIKKNLETNIERNVYFDNKNFEELVIKLLIKLEKYEIAKHYFQTNNLTHDSILLSDVNLFKNLKSQE